MVFASRRRTDRDSLSELHHQEHRNAIIQIEVADLRLYRDWTSDRRVRGCNWPTMGHVRPRFATRDAKLYEGCADGSGGTRKQSGCLCGKGNFRIHLGKGDATAEHLDKTGAKKIAHGAMIFRSGDDLYIVDWKKGD
jgi:hypothetical protein